VKREEEREVIWNHLGEIASLLVKDTRGSPLGS
jgi:hypothetical protein